MQTRLKLKTYSHLLPLERRPTEYDVVTSQLLYHPTAGFEVATPLSAWYKEFLPTDLKNVNWEMFADPRRATYSKYVEQQSRKETFLDGILQRMDLESYDKGLGEDYLAELSEILSVSRYPCHGLQMLTAYVGQMAPAGRIAIAALLQTADEMRRIQRFTYRMVSLSKRHAHCRHNGKQIWETAAQWQPLRRLLERLLVTYGWTEAWAALQFELKPAFDGVFLRNLAGFAESHRDFGMSQILSSLHEDAQWHREWSEVLLETIVADAQENEKTVLDWREKWRAETVDAMNPWREKLTKGMTNAVD